MEVLVGTTIYGMSFDAKKTHLLKTKTSRRQSCLKRLSRKIQRP
jgi:hypothetical protein